MVFSIFFTIASLAEKLFKFKINLSLKGRITIIILVNIFIVFPCVLLNFIHDSNEPLRSSIIIAATVTLFGVITSLITIFLISVIDKRKSFLVKLMKMSYE